MIEDFTQTKIKAQPSRFRTPPMRAKLIFNPKAGAGRSKSVEITEVIRALQSWNFAPEAYLIEPDGDLPGMIQHALKEGIRLFVVCGGDGTISSAARVLAGTDATLGIIPTGTQNNTALSLNIPDNIDEAIALLRRGRRVKVDVGMALCEGKTTPFLEVCSVGLVSSIFPSVDDIQHGNLTRIGDFLTTLAASPPADIRLVLENKKEVCSQGHVALVSNMPIIGFNYQVAAPASFKDGLLDVLFFANLSKLDLLAYVFQGIHPDKPEDPRIQRYQARRVEICTEPAMPVMADGRPLGEGQVSIEVQRGALRVMAPARKA